MAGYNGFLTNFTYGSTAGNPLLAATATGTSNVVAAVPHKWFESGLIACVVTQGVSGGFGAQVVGTIGGATFVIAGITAVTTVGSKILGTTGGATFGLPRPSYVIVQPVAGVAGFTVSFYMAGGYD